MKTIWRRYGAGPGHLAASAAALLIGAAAVIGWSQRPHDLRSVLIWFGAAIVLHDLFLLPVYSLADRWTFRLLPRRVIVFARVPALMSALILATVFPTVLGLGARTAQHASGIAERGYLVRWLALSGALFAASGLVYAVGGSGRRRGPDHATDLLGASRSSSAAAEAPRGDSESGEQP